MPAYITEKTILKEKTLMKNTAKRALSLVLCMAMVLSLFAMAPTASAVTDSSGYECTGSVEQLLKADTDAAAAAGIMAAEQVRRLPVVEQGRLVGMVSLADLSRRQDYMMEAAEALENICAGVRRAEDDLPDF